MHAPDLFRADDRIGVLMFQSDTIGHPVIVMSHTDLALDEVSDPRRVGEEAHGWGEAAWTGDAVGVCWDGDPDGAGALRFREVDGLDGELGRRTDFAVENGPCMELVYAHGVYAMTWRHEDFDVDPAQVETMFAVMARSGELVSDPLTLTSADYPGRSPSLVATDEGFIVVVQVEGGLRMIDVDPMGAPRTDRVISLADMSFSSVAVRDDVLALLSLEGPADTRSLVFRIVTRGGRVLRERRIEAGAPTGAYPRIAARPEGWALVWTEGFRPSERAMMLSLDPAGAPLASRRTLYQGSHSGYGGPAMLSVDDAVYVALSHAGDEAPTGREGTYVQRWECSDPAEDMCRAQQAQAGDCAGEHVWGFRWTGDRCAPVVGCGSDCIGEDCNTLSRTQVACESDRAECAAIACPSTTASLATLCAPAELPSSTSHLLEVEIWGDGCPCTPQPRCRVEATGERELTVSFEQCADPVLDCECEPREPVRQPLTCVAPPLAAGEWTVRADGAEAVFVRVVAPWEMAAEGRVCAVE